MTHNCLNYWSDNSNILVVSDSGSDALLCLFQLCYLPFSMSCNFFSVAKHDALGKRNRLQTALQGCVSEVLGEAQRIACSSRIRFQSFFFLSLVPLDCELHMGFLEPPPPFGGTEWLEWAAFISG